MSQLRSAKFCAGLVVGMTVGWFALPASAVVTTFENGAEGWSLNGREMIFPTGGNPGARLNLFTQSFGAHTVNTTNSEFLGDFTRFGSPIRISIDLNAILVRSVPLGRPLMHNMIVNLSTPTIRMTHELGSVCGTNWARSANAFQGGKS